MILFISFMKIINTNRPYTNPWGTPRLFSDTLFPTFVTCRKQIKEGDIP